MKKAFIDKYSQRINILKMKLRTIFWDLSGECTASEIAAQQAVDEHVAVFFITSDDSLDLRH